MNPGWVIVLCVAGSLLLIILWQTVEYRRELRDRPRPYDQEAER